MGKSKIIWFTLAGMLVGYILMHPFAMLAYILGPHHPHVSWDLFLWGRQVNAAFGVDMIVMALAFSIMGGVAGLSLGAWYRQKERLVQEQLETERRQAALNTVRQLMVTLAHHIRNANMVIGGFSSRMIKHLSDPGAQGQLQLIQQASREIEAVIASLESLAQIDHVRYISEWETKMIDLKQELETRLAAFESPKEVS